MKQIRLAASAVIQKCVVGSAPDNVGGGATDLGMFEALSDSPLDVKENVRGFT